MPAPGGTYNRDAITQPTNCPTWAASGVFEIILYGIGLMLDVLNEGERQGMLAHMPGQGNPDALSFVGNDRQIDRGFAESDTAYALRNQQAFDRWATAGNAWAVLANMMGYVAPVAPQMRAVKSAADASISVWDTCPSGTTPPLPPTHLVVTPANWDWDGASQPYYYPWLSWRAWPILYSLGGSPWAAPSQTWSTGGSFFLSTTSSAIYGTIYIAGGVVGTTTFHWGDGTCFGWAGTAVQAAELVRLVAKWKDAACWVPWIIVSYDSTMFDPTLAIGSSKLPDGHWGYYGKVISDATYGTIYTSARPASSTCTFIAGPIEGDPTIPQGQG